MEECGFTDARNMVSKSTPRFLTDDCTPYTELLIDMTPLRLLQQTDNSQISMIWIMPLQFHKCQHNFRVYSKECCGQSSNTNREIQPRLVDNSKSFVTLTRSTHLMGHSLFPQYGEQKCMDCESMGPINCLVTNIPQNIFFCVL